MHTLAHILHRRGFGHELCHFIVKLHSIINMLKDDNVSAKEKNDLLKDIIGRIEYSSIDKGRNKGSEITLDIYLL